MVLRLVLVGIVAGLGVSPPAESELASWPRSVQTWLDARLAEYDARLPVDEDEGAFLLDGEAPVAKETESKVSARDEETDALADPDFEAMDDEEVTAEHADGPATGRPALVEDTDAVEGLVFDAVVEEMVAEFTRVEAATRAQTPAEADGAVDLEPGLADAMDQEAEVGESVPSKVEPVVRAPAFEPLEVGDDLYPGEAFALNREAQGLDEPAPAGVADPTGEVPAGNQLKNAVRLTRDAVYAWMNLIQSPAIVTIPR